MLTIQEHLIELGIASNVFQATHIANGLKLYELKTIDAQVERCQLYRLWRPKTDKKDMIPTYQAYDLAIAGIDPADMEVRQIDFMQQVVDDEEERFAIYHATGLL